MRRARSLSPFAITKRFMPIYEIYRHSRTRRTDVIAKLLISGRVTQRDLLHLCQLGIPVARRPIRTPAPFWRRKNMRYSRQKYVLSHTSNSKSLRCLDA